MRLFVRLIAVVPWGVAFFVALLAVLVILGLNGTFLNQTFYQDQLKDADIYRFALVDVLESALDEARQLPPEEFGIGFRDNPLVASGLSTSQLAGAVRNALSPDDLEELLAPSVLGFGEYMAGEKDEIDLTIDASGHISGIADEALALLRDSGAYDRILEKEVEPRIREAAGDILPVTEDASGWPEYLFGSGEEAEDGLVRVVKSAVTSEWLAAQAERALPVLTAYLVGNTDTFEIRIRLDDLQAAAVTEETKDIVRETNLYDLVFDDVVEPAVEDALGVAVVLPFGVKITKYEVLSALRQVASPVWVQEQTGKIVDDVSAYVTGKSDEFSTQISLTEPKEEGAPLLKELAGSKLAELLARLPACSTTPDAAATRNSLTQTVPVCIPPGFSVDDYVEAAGPIIDNSVRTFVLAPVPGTVTLTEGDVRSHLGESAGQKALKFLDDLRELHREGWIYNQDDLRSDLSANRDALQILDEARSYLSDGYVHTYQDPSGVESYDRIAFALDVARHWSNTLRRYKWWAYLAAPVLLVVIGLIGGTSWRSRVGWASAVLLLAALTIIILSWPVYEVLSKHVFEQVRTEALAQTGGTLESTSNLIVAKSIEFAQMTTDAFISGIRGCSLALAVIACIGLLVAVQWRRISEWTEPRFHEVGRRWS